jgi:rhodanese-related sulfurtransferase
VPLTLVFMSIRAAKVPSHITGPALLAQIEAGTAPAILDVRSRREFADGHVPGALHIPFWAVLTRLSEIPASPSEPVVVYCGHGPRAYAAGAALWIAGFRRVVYLEGHMWKWRQAGLRHDVGFRLPVP